MGLRDANVWDRQLLSLAFFVTLVLDTLFLLVVLCKKIFKSHFWWSPDIQAQNSDPTRQMYSDYKRQFTMLRVCQRFRCLLFFLFSCFFSFFLFLFFCFLLFSFFWRTGEIIDMDTTSNVWDGNFWLACFSWMWFWISVLLCGTKKKNISQSRFPLPPLPPPPKCNAGIQQENVISRFCFWVFFCFFIYWWYDKHQNNITLFSSDVEVMFSFFLLWWQEQEE